MPTLARLAVAFSLALIASITGGQPAHASPGAERDCGPKIVRGSVPLPHRGRAFRVDIIIKDDCSVEIGSPTELSAEEAQNNDKDKDKDRDSARGKQHRAPLSRIGSTPEYLDPDYHMDAHIWDCCNIIMTRLVTDLNWTTDGVTITGWNAGGYQSYHGEFSCGPGWYPVNSYLVQNGGGTGDVYIGVHSHAEWGYQGVFDCSGSYYSNTFDNYIWGDILSRGSCDYGFYLRHTATNWHLQIQCYNPLITKFDQWY